MCLGRREGVGMWIWVAAEAVADRSDIVVVILSEALGHESLWNGINQRGMRGRKRAMSSQPM